MPVSLFCLGYLANSVVHSDAPLQVRLPFQVVNGMPKVNGMLKVARNVLNIREVWNPVCCHGNQTVMLIFWSTISRILLQRIKPDFWYKLTDWDIVFHHIWSKFLKLTCWWANQLASVGSAALHVCWYPMNITIKTHSISSKTDQDTDQETWILHSLNTKHSQYLPLQSLLTTTIRQDLIS